MTHGGPKDKCPCETHTQKKQHMKMETEAEVTQAQAKDCLDPQEREEAENGFSPELPGGAQPHPDLTPLASRTVSRCVSIVLSHLVGGASLPLPQETNTALSPP